MDRQGPVGSYGGLFNQSSPIEPTRSDEAAMKECCACTDLVRLGLLDEIGAAAKLAWPQLSRGGGTQ